MRKTISRRDLLKTSAAAGAGALLFAEPLRAAAPAAEPVTDNFVLPDWMKVPGEAPPAYLDPKATTSAGLKRLLDQIENASPLEQGRMLAALVKLLVERGLLDVKEVIAALNKS